MQVFPKSVAVVLLATLIGSSALANGPSGYYPQEYHHGHASHPHGGSWVAPLLFLGLAGAAIGAAASHQSAPPPPVYAQPPVTYVQPQVTYMQPAPTYMAPAPVAPPQPANVWYFCKSAGQYYPYTQYCPEGWRLVPATP
jgi:hypothetical protein